MLKHLLISKKLYLLTVTILSASYLSLFNYDAVTSAKNHNLSVNENPANVVKSTSDGTPIAGEIDTLLNIPIYDAKSSITHPSVIYVPNGWNGYKYWMVFTPYPDAARENPSIVVSNDGLNWIVPQGLSNPVCSREEAVRDRYQYNSDPNLLLKNDSTMVMYYRLIYGYPDKNEGLFRKTSKDGIHWENKKELFTSPSTLNCKSFLSPSVLQLSSNQFVMWTVNDNTSDNSKRVEIRTSTDGENWDSVNVCNMPKSLKTWHLEVRFANNYYYMLAVDASKYRLHLLRSKDGLSWDLLNRELPRQGKIDGKGNYKSSFIINQSNPLSFWIWSVGIRDNGPTVWTSTHQIMLIKNLSVDFTQTENEKRNSINFELHQNFPNPFNGVTEICYYLTKEDMVTLRVYDLTGNLIMTLINETQKEGSYKVKFDPGHLSRANELSSGIYFYELVVGTKSVSKKMVYLK